MGKHLDQYHYHEMLERASLLSPMVELMTQHPVAKQHVEVRRQVDKVIKECAELYAICGKITFNKYDEQQD